MERLLTVDQVAERLQVNEQTVRRWLRDGELTGVPFRVRTGWRVSEEDLQAFLQHRRLSGGEEAIKKPVTWLVHVTGSRPPPRISRGGHAMHCRNVHDEISIRRTLTGSLPS